MLTVKQSIAKALASAACLQRPTTVRLANATARVLASDVLSPSPLPRERLATMDGFACRASELKTELEIIGESMAGAPFVSEVGVAQAIRIATGAVVPVQLDWVVPFENATATSTKVKFTSTKGDNIRQVGEDLAGGDLVAGAGSRLTNLDVGLLASLGIDRVVVHAKPVVGLISTGDELREIGSQLPSGAIYDANRLLLAGLLEQLGVESIDLGLVGDKLDDLSASLDRAADSCDVIITSGGASVGTRDLIKQALAKHGELHVWKVAIKPGKPLVIGSYRGLPLYGLPGNPASAYVCLMQLIAPALWKLAGRDPLPNWLSYQAISKQKFTSDKTRLDYQRAVAELGQDGNWQVVSAGNQSSASLSCLANANCLVAIPVGQATVAIGSKVQIMPITGCII